MAAFLGRCKRHVVWRSDKLTAETDKPEPQEKKASVDEQPSTASQEETRPTRGTGARDKPAESRPRRRATANPEEREAVKKLADQQRRELESTKVLVWPDLVYTELMSAILCTVVIMVVSLVFDGPLEELANPNKTPLPSRAPWYFLGLQELLVYFDPWIAGVILPTMILVGLMLIPYVDTKPYIGNGSYTWKGREWQIGFFAFGFLTWILLILIGQYFRWGPWAWYWPGESREHVKVIAEDLVWSPSIGIPKPDTLWDVTGIFIFLGFYASGLIAPLLAEGGRRYFRQLGLLRYSLVMIFVLTLLFTFVKIFMRMVLHWKYVVVTPWFNI